MRFQDRQEAGKILADTLEKYRGQSCIVYALPRGGVVVAREVASSLNAPLDLIIPRKVGHPTSPEYAVCAVGESGYLLCHDVAKNLDQEWLAQAVEREKQEARRRREVYLGQNSPVSPHNKTAIIVDDGIATGLTMKVAIHDIKSQQPKKIVIAVPVAPSDTIEQLRNQVDEVICLSSVPAGYFGAVGAYYENFDQVSDQEVIALLHSHQ